MMAETRMTEKVEKDSKLYFFLLGTCATYKKSTIKDRKFFTTKIIEQIRASRQRDLRPLFRNKELS